MLYATVQDLVDRFGETELIQLTDPDGRAVDAAKVELALQDARALADGWLCQVYALPLAGCTKPAPTPQDPQATTQVAPPQLSRLVCDVARYYLYDDLAPESEVVRRFNRAAQELKDIAEGRAQLTCPWGGAPGQLLSADAAPGGGEVWFDFRPRQVTPDVDGGYK